MLSVLRITAHDLGTLWLTIGRVIRDRGATVLMLLLLGWACYFSTILVTGFVAPYWAWAAIPLMGAGCLVQLIVTLAAYRIVIEYADSLTDSPSLQHIALMPLVSTMIVPFTAAYSTFGFFTKYAHDAAMAGNGLVGTFADAAFLNQINPLLSARTFVICISVFIGLWIAARLVQLLNSRVGTGHRIVSTGLTLLSAFCSICNTFLVLFSIFRVYGRIQTWVQTRQFMSWGESAAVKIASVTHIAWPDVISAVWAWITTTLWPLFWDVLSQPVLWLSVVALVGGMQFIDINTVWNRLRRRLRPRNQPTDTVVPSVDLGGLSQTVLPFFHLLWVILRSGVPFLMVLVLSYTAVNRMGAWVDFVIDKLVGPIPSKYVFLVQPLFELFDMVFITGLLAILLATVYVRLRHGNAQADHDQSSRFTWQHLIVTIVGVALAVAISTPVPSSSDRIVRLTPGVPTTVMSATVTVDSLRVGHSLEGKWTVSSSIDTPIQSEGVFVAVKMTIYSYAGGVFTVTATAGGVTYRTWDGTSSVSITPGYTENQDFVFEIPVDQIKQMDITFTPVLSLRSIIAIGKYRVPSDSPVDTVITIDESGKEHVP